MDMSASFKPDISTAYRMAMTQKEAIGDKKRNCLRVRY
ncbi:MAG: hypothetical protein Rpha_1898 [Candidatus Ruthia sp. Apha_13_S6]|nr:hypothetical protein [Candidatus Ruthia sp. Apha_13_S6]